MVGKTRDVSTVLHEVEKMCKSHVQKVGSKNKKTTDDESVGVKIKSRF
jgi:hypothetical protein